VNIFTRVSFFLDWIVKSAAEAGTFFYANEYVCKDGKEIAFTAKCNGSYDCTDMDDEISCGK
jgi:hypothetical protein